MWIWQASRDDSSTQRPTLPPMEYAPAPGFRNLIFSLQTNHMDLARMSADCDGIRLDLGRCAGFRTRRNATHAPIGSASDDNHAATESRIEAKRDTRFCLIFATGGLWVGTYGNFREFINRPELPAEADAIILRVGLLRPGGTLGMYLPHVANASIVLRKPTNWVAYNARSVSNGIRNESAKSPPLRNFTTVSDFLALLKYATPPTDFALAALLAFRLMLRVPTGTLQMRRADGAGRSTEYFRREFKILLWIRLVGGSELLVAKFARRKITKQGCVRRRPCLCEEESCMARIFSPANKVPPAIREWAPIRGLHFASSAASAFNLELRRATMGAGYAYGGEYPPRCFRRGYRAGASTSGNIYGYDLAARALARKAFQFVYRRPNDGPPQNIDTYGGSYGFRYRGGSGYAGEFRAGGIHARGSSRFFLGALELWPEDWRRVLAPWVFNLSDDIGLAVSKSSPADRASSEAGAP